MNISIYKNKDFFFLEDYTGEYKINNLTVIEAYESSVDTVDFFSIIFEKMEYLPDGFQINVRYWGVIQTPYDFSQMLALVTAAFEGREMGYYPYRKYPGNVSFDEFLCYTIAEKYISDFKFKEFEVREDTKISFGDKIEIAYTITEDGKYEIQAVLDFGLNRIITYLWDIPVRVLQCEDLHDFVGAIEMLVFEDLTFVSEEEIKAVEELYKGSLKHMLDARPGTHSITE